MSGSFARPGRLEAGLPLTVRYIKKTGERGEIAGVLTAVFGRPDYGHPIGLQLAAGPAQQVRGIAGLLDSVPERSSSGRILVLLVTSAQDVDV